MRVTKFKEGKGAKTGKKQMFSGKSRATILRAIVQSIVQHSYSQVIVGFIGFSRHRRNKERVNKQPVRPVPAGTRENEAAAKGTDGVLRNTIFCYHLSVVGGRGELSDPHCYTVSDRRK